MHDELIYVQLGIVVRASGRFLVAANIAKQASLQMPKNIGQNGWDAAITVLILMLTNDDNWVREL